MQTSLQTRLPGIDPEPIKPPEPDPWCRPIDDPPDRPPAFVWMGDGALLMMEFHQAQLKSGDPVWFDDRNTPSRCVIRRAENRFQAYQRDGEEWYSMGYFLNRASIRPFLRGDGAELMSEWGEDTEREPVVYPVLPLNEY